MKMKLILVAVSMAALAVSADCQAMFRRAPAKVRASMPRALTAISKCNARSFSNKRSNHTPIFGPEYELANLGQEFKRFRYSHNCLTEKITLNRPGALEWTSKEKERFSSYCPILKEWVNSTIEMNAKYYAGFDQIVRNHLDLHHKLSYVQRLQKSLPQEQKQEVMKSYLFTRVEIAEIVKEHMTRLKVRDDIQ